MRRNLEIYPDLPILARHAVRCLLACFLFSCSGTDTGNPITRDDDQRITLIGTYLDSSQKPVPSCSLWIRALPAIQTQMLARVRAQADSPFVDLSLFLGDSGSFEISGVPAGRYVLMAVSRQTGLGHQLRLDLSGGDTLRIQPEHLIMDSLSVLPIRLDSSWIGKTVRIPELGLVLHYSGDTLIPGVPRGVYTLIANDSGKAVILRSQSDLPTSNLDSTSSQDTTSTLPPDTATPYPVQWDSLTQRFVGSIDGQAYPVIQSGALYWTARNVATLIDSLLCHPLDTTAHCSRYGRFYTQSQAQRACPAPWRLPTVADWQSLIDQAGGADSAAVVLKSTSGWDYDANGSDSLGFSALPTGTSFSDIIGKQAVFWSADTTTQGQGIAYRLFFASVSIEQIAENPELGFSVRCILDVP